MSEIDSWFDLLYRKYAASMVKVAPALLGNRAKAEEIVQDVFVILLLKRSEIEHYEYLGA